MYPFELLFSCSLGKHTVVWLLDHNVVLYLTLWGTVILFSTVGSASCIPQQCKRVAFYPHPPNICFLVLVLLANLIVWVNISWRYFIWIFLLMVDGEHLSWLVFWGRGLPRGFSVPEVLSAKSSRPPQGGGFWGNCFFQAIVLWRFLYLFTFFFFCLDCF